MAAHFWHAHWRPRPGAPRMATAWFPSQMVLARCGWRALGCHDWEKTLYRRPPATTEEVKSRVFDNPDAFGGGWRLSEEPATADGQVPPLRKARRGAPTPDNALHSGNWVIAADWRNTEAPA